MTNDSNTLPRTNPPLSSAPRFVGDFSLERLCNDAMPYPERFNSREEWNDYNERLSDRENSYEYLSLKGGI